MTAISSNLGRGREGLRFHSLETIYELNHPSGCMKGCLTAMILFWILLAFYVIFFYDFSAPVKEVIVPDTFIETPVEDPANPLKEDVGILWPRDFPQDPRRSKFFTKGF